MSDSGKVGAVLVVGGGIGGVQTALDLGDSGYKVYLVERASAIGGVMAMLDKTFPTNDCSMCILSPKLVAAGRHENIELMTQTEVLGVSGEPGNLKVRLKRYARSVDLAKCTGCGDCLTKCPVRDLPNEFEGGLSKRRAIYRMYAQAVPNAPTIDRTQCLKFTRDKCGACQKSCKAGAIDYTQQDEEIEVEVGSIVVAAGSKIAPTGLRPEYGHGRYPNVVTSLEYERILSASGPYSGHVKRPSDGKEPKRIAWLQCVGSRDDSVERGYCSAMCCMYAVKEAVITKEHAKHVEPAVFYMDMRSYGKDFDKYVERAEQQYGVRLVRARVAEVREDPETKNLVLRFAGDGGQRSQEFDMVVLSCGFVPPPELIELSKRLDFELDKYGFAATDQWGPIATTRDGVSVAGSFAQPMAIPEAVTGASGAAAAAEEVLAAERGKLAAVKEVPAETDVRGEAPRIGVFVCHCGINIGGVVRVPEVTEYARSLPHVVFAEENLYSCSGDTQEKIKDRIREHRLNRVVVASCSPRTHEPLFQATVTEAGLNPHLFAMTNIRDQCSWVHMKEPDKATEKSKDLVKMAVARALRLKPLPKVKLPVTKAGLVVGGGVAGMTSALALAGEGFDVFLVEQEKTLGGNARTIATTVEGDDVKARLEELVGKVTSHPRIKVYSGARIKAIDGFVGNFQTTLQREERGERREESLKHGAVVVATGAQYRTPTEYGYGQSDRVLSQKELEEILSGSRQSPVAIRQSQSIVMIQCVGSRDEERPYCSRICCAEAVKNGLKVKEVNPDADIYVLYRDIRTYGLREEYYRQARQKGVVFIRYSPEQKPEVRIEDGKPLVSVFDPILGQPVELSPDLLVLSSGLVPQAGSDELAKMLKVPLNADGFFLEAHMKLRPVDFATEGVFMAGLCHFPKFIDEAAAQAKAAAGRAATILSRDTLEAEATVASVNPDRCSACHMCEGLCAYRAIEVKTINERTGKQAAVVNEALCKGCGACAANCRSLAIDIRGFQAENISREIAALLD
ncbi:CoB--CoM heterodisulfide reductase iron-sulfur subunit A family protein [candidate division WOR-3 bacterium]|nr:CoB--CoM heterodisulfide reductase iron-sulfur subunit A family protein [candidate division WOR-3 bacterium]